MSNIEDTLSRARRRRLPDPRSRRFLREQAGLTQTDLARVVSVARSTVAHWENGRRHPRGATLDRYAAVLERLKEEIA